MNGSNYNFTTRVHTYHLSVRRAPGQRGQVLNYYYPISLARVGNFWPLCWHYVPYAAPHLAFTITVAYVKSGSSREWLLPSGKTGEMAARKGKARS